MPESTSTKQPRLPGESNRITIIGQTGTGKTVAGLWHLSNQNLERPWVIVNSKGDEHIDSLPYTQEIDFSFELDKYSRGLYILRPLPMDMKRPRPDMPSRMETFLWKIWAREDCGLFYDELFMLGPNEAVDAIYTQGRSKLVPVIGCTQRPVWITRFAFSEASFIQVFDLIDQRDINTIEGFVPVIWDEEIPLDEHQSYYFDVGQKALYRWKPVPDMNAIRKVFKAKLHRRWVLI